MLSRIIQFDFKIYLKIDTIRRSEKNSEGKLTATSAAPRRGEWPLVSTCGSAEEGRDDKIPKDWKEE